jgi:hypothetical protein
MYSKAEVEPTVRPVPVREFFDIFLLFPALQYARWTYASLVIIIVFVALDEYECRLKLFIQLLKERWRTIFPKNSLYN